MPGRFWGWQQAKKPGVMPGFLRWADTLLGCHAVGVVMLLVIAVGW